MSVCKDMQNACLFIHIYIIYTMTRRGREIRRCGWRHKTLIMNIVVIRHVYVRK